MLIFQILRSQSTSHYDRKESKCVQRRRHKSDTSDENTDSIVSTYLNNLLKSLQDILLAYQDSSEEGETCTTEESESDFEEETEAEVTIVRYEFDDYPPEVFNESVHENL